MASDGGLKTKGKVPVNGAADRLLLSSVKLFAEKGYAATSVREITEAAQVTRPVLYYHFKSKDRLFCHIVEAQFDEVCAEIDEILETVSGCRQRLRTLVQKVFDRTERSPEMVRLLLQFFFSPPVENLRLDKEVLGRKRFSRIAEIMRQGLDSGELSGGDAEMLAMAFSGVMDMHVMARSSGSGAGLTPEFGDALVDLFLDGAGLGRVD